MENLDISFEQAFPFIIFLLSTVQVHHFQKKLTTTFKTKTICYKETDVERPITLCIENQSYFRVVGVNDSFKEEEMGITYAFKTLLNIIAF